MDALKDRTILSGIRVLDLSSVMAGPVCSRMLADLGAEVIKVEPPEGDQMRHRPPMRDGRSSYYASLNCGKISITVDLKSSDGQEHVKSLAKGADVVVENFRPGVVDRLGLSYECLAADNPRLVFCSISGFGQTGPYAQRPAYAPVMHALSGFDMTNMRYQDGASIPPNCGIFVADVLAGVHAFGAIQAALFHRERTGAGQSIDVSMLEAMLNLLVYEVQEAQFPQTERRFLFSPCKTADGFLMVAPTSRRNFERFCETIERPDLVADDRFESQPRREANWSLLMGITEAWAINRSTIECERLLSAAGVPCSRYNAVGDLLNDPHLGIRGAFRSISDGSGSSKIMNLPFRFSASPTSNPDWVADLGEVGAGADICWSENKC